MSATTHISRRLMATVLVVAIVMLGGSLMPVWAMPGHSVSGQIVNVAPTAPVDRPAEMDEPEAPTPWFPSNLVAIGLPPDALTDIFPSCFAYRRAGFRDPIERPPRMA